ncbi:MAG TPA: thiamine biosynthesis protein ThiW [Chloroflexi bacterium]|nr:thiamine biosynthesis protein ThiW [Chloroflexota bacterium]
MPEAVIEIGQLRYRYSTAETRWALDGLNLRIEPGEYLLICGASGSGKSTLCRTFNGLIPHFYGGLLEGHVWVGGQETRTQLVSDLYAHVGLVFQNPQAQLFTGTVECELAFGLESLGLPKAEIRRRVEESAGIVGLSHLLARNPHQLSGGEQQLVAIAAALALHPAIIVLDEPYASLDPANVSRVRAALREIHRRGTAIVLTEHRLSHAIADVERIVVLDQGRIVLDGPPQVVLQEEVEAFGLNLPPVVRLARDLDLPEVPLTVEAAVRALRYRGRLPAWLEEPPSSLAPPTGSSVLQVEDVAFTFEGRPVLQGVCLNLCAGDCLAVVGANGSGKTTLIKHFNGLYRPTQGRVLVLGQDTRQTKVSHLARHVGLAFQNANDQFFRFQVREEIEVGPRTLGCFDEGWLQELVTLFGLKPLLERSPYRLSEGEKKRVAFAAALATRPEILVLDEPTTGQDWAFRQALGDLLGELRARGQTVVLVTHDLEFAEQHADRWVLLADGRVLANGAPWTLMRNETALRRASLEPTQRFQLHLAFSQAQNLQELRE